MKDYVNLVECDAESESSELVEEHVERLRYSRCRHCVALDDCLVCLGASSHVVGLDGEDFLEHM